MATLATKQFVLSVTALLLLLPLMASTAFAACSSCPGCTGQRIGNKRKVTLKTFSAVETQSMKSIKWDLSVTDGWFRMWLTSNGRTVEVGNSATAGWCRHEEVDIQPGTAYTLELECYLGRASLQKICYSSTCYYLTLYAPCTGYSGASLSAGSAGSSSASSKTTIIIAVCCSVGGALLIALVVVLCCCCRRSPAGPANGPNPNPSDPHAHGGDTNNQGATVIELCPQPVAVEESSGAVKTTEDTTKEYTESAV